MQGDRRRAEERAGKKLTEDVRLDDGTTNIDSLDAMEYALERYIPELIEKWNFQS